LVLLEAGDHEMLWPGVARTPKSPAGQQPRVPKWKPPLGSFDRARGPFSRARSSAWSAHRGCARRTIRCPPSPCPARCAPHVSAPA